MNSEGLAFQGISKVFDDGTEALQPVDFHVGASELVALVGPSGCGKSTLLRIAAGLEQPTSGAATCGGNVGYVFQDATLLPWRSVERNVALGAELVGMSRVERARRVAEAINLVGLAGFEHHSPATLSGGMRMRVSLARALVLQPSVFLFDEPFGALDEMTRERLNEELLRLFGLHPFAGLLVTHNIYEAVFCAGRVLVMSPRPGRIVHEVRVPFGYPRPPKLRFTAEYAAVTGEVSAALRGELAVEAVV